MVRTSQGQKPILPRLHPHLPSVRCPPPLSLQNPVKIPAGGARIMLYLLELLEAIGLIPNTQDYWYLGESWGWATLLGCEGGCRGQQEGMGDNFLLSCSEEVGVAGGQIHSR